MDANFVTGLRSAPPGASFLGFERFFREQYPTVVRIASGVVGDAHAAQDVAQDVFIGAFRGDPFRALAAPAWQYLAWAGIWLLLVLALGMVSLARREL